MKLKVLFCSSEVAPFAKTGGLAEVAGTLPQALGRLGVECVVVMPKYRGINGYEKRLGPNCRIYFIENEEYFNRYALYGTGKGDYPDNLQRFFYFCNEALFLAKAIRFQPHLLHAHDWQTALLPVLLKTAFASDRFFSKTSTIFTIHNLAYQGIFSHRQYETLGLDPGHFSIDGFEFYGRMNLMKAGIIFADALSTVSPSYAQEIKTAEFGFGLEGVIQNRADGVKGILNGIDADYWNPPKDTFIAKPYSALRMAGKQVCKEQLQRRCKLTVNPRIPVFGIVTRLAEQKGLDILSEICDELLGLDVQLVLLGDGDRVYQTTFKNVAARHPKNTSVTIGFSQQQAHAIYAGSDFFLMPSYYEPCGLSQMISMRYGTVPIVRSTGGLSDTVIDADDNPARGNGFVFEGSSPETLMRAVRRALEAYGDPKRMLAIRRQGMREDFSWKASAAHYKEYYESVWRRR